MGFSSENKHDEFRKELVAVFEKHGVSAGAYCGTMDDAFVGGSTLEKTSFINLMGVVGNVGRLWQWAKENNRDALRYLETGKH